MARTKKPECFVDVTASARRAGIRPKVFCFCTESVLRRAGWTEEGTVFPADSLCDAVVGAWEGRIPTANDDRAANVAKFFRFEFPSTNYVVAVARLRIQEIKCPCCQCEAWVVMDSAAAPFPDECPRNLLFATE